ncbi:CYFA0S07e04918g1_1 [Cyberlindnera fabianii]|uniref:non-specific serine/threonine protein kinase n=1 Tax=Cyberlindnera fabianii TaxID=36022 RepID=A0A061AWT3_CYBFA|nr:CYFA0S07e04918g1_1 [Cyberlindnera fabianii]
MAGSQAPRRVSLLSTSLAQIREESRSRTGTPQPSQAETSAHTHSQLQDHKQQRTSSVTRPNVPQSRRTQQRHLLNDDLNFEIVPDSTSSPILKRFQEESVSHTSKASPTAQNLRPKPVDEVDRLITLGDELIPSGMTTPVLTPSPKSSTPTPPVFSPSTPIRSDSHAASLRKNHSLLKQQDSAKIIKQQTLDTRVRSKSKLHRALSESETHNFDPIHGRRINNDERHRPIKFDRFNSEGPREHGDPVWSYAGYSTHIADKERREVADRYDLWGGANDEYLPDLDFGATVDRWNSVSLEQLTGADTSLEDSSISLSSSAGVSLGSTPMGPLHAQVSPMNVPLTKKQMDDEERVIMESLPENFNSLKFSERRKIIASLSGKAHPDVLKKVNKEASRSRSKSSFASQFLSSLGSQRSLKSWENGSVIMGYTLRKTIGHGAWGFVRECTGPEPARDTKAMKIIRIKGGGQHIRNIFLREVQIWQQLKHPNILPLVNVTENTDCIFCLTYKATGGSLYDLAAKWGVYNAENLPTPKTKRLQIIKEYMLQIISALDYMHSKGIVHGDVKLENCLIDISSLKKKIWLCDFGMSQQFKVIEQENGDIMLKDRMIKRRPSIPRSLSDKELKGIKSLAKILQDSTKVHDDTKVLVPVPSTAVSDDTDVLSFDASPLQTPHNHHPQPGEPKVPDQHIGSLLYAAPELLEAAPPPLGPTADIWALGVLFYALCVGRLPFSHAYEPRLKAMIQKGDYDLASFIEAVDLNEHFIDTLRGLLTQPNTERATLHNVSVLIKNAKFW